MWLTGQHTTPCGARHLLNPSIGSGTNIGSSAAAGSLPSLVFDKHRPSGE